ncbi:hypothetical protein FQR65_LT12725 [Abscondita terminalis]|nr:hypothetical protein FQR65_LT12725 [Abscondita terminalis]
MSSSKGPGYATPLDAMKNGPKEDLLYVAFNDPNPQGAKTDFLGTIDVNPNSSTYCKVIHKTYTGFPDDQLHHFGWNVCSSCHRKKSSQAMCPRDKIVLPGLETKRIYIIDVGKNPRAPQMHKIIDSELETYDLSYLHSSHCLPTGEVMISYLGDNDGNSKGNFLLLDAKSFEVKGTWSENPFEYCYDFWYQPYHDIMVFSEFGAPKNLRKGFEVEQIPKYGRHLNLYSWSTKKFIKRIDLGDDGIVCLTVRFLHDPKESQAYVSGGLNSHIFRLYKTEQGTWDTEKVISVNPKKVEGWMLDSMPGLITDFIISLDDRYLYVPNFLHGDIRQYDISDRRNPKLTGQITLGGLLLKDSKIKVLEDKDLDARPDPVFIKGHRLYGGPHRLQLSLDGKRLYASSGMYKPWDKQFFPENFIHGGFLVKIDCDTVNGGMTLDTDFYVDFNEENGGPLFPHEIRYPGGDCSSDIWLADE